MLTQRRAGMTLTAVELDPGDVLEFTPGTRVALHEETPFPAGCGFFVRVRHRGGDEKRWVEPGATRVIGTFEFDEGTDGFVEILAEGARGQAVADAVVFEPVEEPAAASSPRKGVKRRVVPPQRAPDHGRPVAGGLPRH